MMQRNATNAVRPPSLVDTLGSGFRTSHRAAMALLVPMFLSLWYWQGPRISLQPLLDWLRSLNPTTWDQLRTQLDTALPPGQVFDLRVAGIIEQSWFFWFWRRLYAYLPSDAVVLLWQPAQWSVGGFTTLFGTIFGLNIVFSLLVTLYLMLLADAVRGTSGRGIWIVRMLDAWMRILGVQWLVVVLLLVAGIPLFVVVGLIAQVVPLIGAFLASALTVAILWLMFTTSFAYDAVVLNRSNPVRALLSSLVVVRKSFWSVIGLYILIGLILTGFNVIWQGLETTLVGMIVVVLTSAYVSTGLATAHLRFYHDRLLAHTSTS